MRLFVISSAFILFGCDPQSGSIEKADPQSGSVEKVEPEEVLSSTPDHLNDDLEQTSNYSPPEKGPLSRNDLSSEMIGPLRSRNHVVGEEENESESNAEEQEATAQQEEVLVNNADDDVLGSPLDSNGSDGIVEFRLHGGPESEIAQVQGIDSNGLPWLGIHGFVNGRNQNCYFTSVIQVLYHTRTFYNGLVAEGNLPPSGIPENVRNVLTESQALAREMWTANGHSSLHADHIIERMRQFTLIPDVFVVGRHNSSQVAIREYLSALAQVGYGDWFQMDNDLANRVNMITIASDEFDGTSESIAYAILARGFGGFSSLIIVELETQINAPEYLNLEIVTANYMDQYRLVGQVFHQGTHFSSMFRHEPTNVWVSASDGLVQVIDPSRNQHQSSILTVYERIV